MSFERLAADDVPARADALSDMDNPSSPATRRLGDRELRMIATPSADAAGPAAPSPRPRSELVCRVANVAIASLALGISAPLLLLVAAVIKCTSRGPILYRQTRVGLDRRTRQWSQNYTLYDRRLRDVGGCAFTIYKFRTMRVDAEAGVGAVWATQRDPRVTAVGRFLRKTRIDEIPQLWNVIRGDMNIVGPRPERPRLVAQLREHIAEYPLRHRARPGITGWAQINQAYDGSMEDVRRKVRYDLQYLERQSMTEDLLIMVRTIPVILLRRGAN
jgi:lipopolysaccharide/colanic/teichoic acid biosynthesis glycosyltransferase